MFAHSPTLGILSQKKLDGFLHTEITVTVPKLDPVLEGYHLLQLTDLHYGPVTSAKHLRKAFSLVNALAPDLILFTGDFVQNGYLGVRERLATQLNPSLFRWRDYRRRVRTLCSELGGMIAELRPRHGMVGVFGNHDHLEGIRSVTSELAGIRWLINASLLLGPSSGGVVISGVDDWKRGKFSLTDTTASLNSPVPIVDEGAKTDEPSMTAGELQPALSILLCHNPDAVLDPTSSHILRYHVMLSGHTHGGQLIPVPGMRAPITRTKQKFHVQGLSNFGTTSVYVNNGLGFGGVPFRLFCPPEITSFRLTGRR